MIGVPRRPASLALLAALALSPAAGAAGAAAAAADRAATVAKIDAIFSSWIRPDEPGGTVLVRKGADVLLRKGYGLANVELGLPAAPEQSYQIGSLTKQFTAAAMLMLVDQGKLRLSEPLSRYIESLPAWSRQVKIEHLLTHTAGLYNYVNSPDWPLMWRKDLTVHELIALFANKPLDALPGERFKYSNSGYVLAGAILEKVTGGTYADFVEQQIFAPLGMKRSYYNAERKILPGRVPGYSKTADGWENTKNTINPSQTYSAGALMSSIDDLDVWQHALVSGRLFSRELFDKSLTPFELNSGLHTGYGYGWAVSVDRGHRVAEHGGANQGFYSAVVYLPEDDVYVAFLTNRQGYGDDAKDLALRAAKVAAGLPDFASAPKVPARDVDEILGTYGVESDPATQLVLYRDAGKLMAWRKERGPTPAFVWAKDEVFSGDGAIRLTFERGADGKVADAKLALAYVGENRLPRLSDSTALPASAVPRPPESTTAVAADNPLAAFVGTYQVGPAMTAVLTVSPDGQLLMLEAMGFPPYPLQQTGDDEFLLQVISGKIRFVKEGGKVTGLVLTQDNQQITGTKVK